MAIKLTELLTATTFAPTDLIYRVTELGATPLSKKQAVSDFRGYYDSREYATLEDADAEAAADGKLLIIAKNHILTANTVLIASIKRIPGGSFTGASTYTLAFSGSFENPSNGHCFIGFSRSAVSPYTCPISFDKDVEIKPEWFGVTADGTTNDRTNFQFALDVLAASGKGSFKTQDGKTYRFGDGGNESIYVYASNVVYNLGTSKFLGNFVISGNYDVGDMVVKPQNVIINNGIYAPIGAAGVARYDAANNGLAILIGNNIHVKNPKFILGAGTRGISIQTSEAWGTAPFKNITNIIIDNPIIEGQLDPFAGDATVNGIDIGATASAAMPSPIENVQINNPIISNCYIGASVSTGGSVYVMDNISINTMIANNISDMGLTISGARNSSFSAIINNVGWKGAEIIATPNTVFPHLIVRGYSTLATPPTMEGVSHGLLVYEGTIKGATIFGKVSVEGYDASNKFAVGIATHSKDAIYQSVHLKNITTGITANTEIGIWGTVVMNGVTTRLTAPLGTYDFYKSIIDTSGTVPVEIHNRYSTANAIDQVYSIDGGVGQQINLIDDAVKTIFGDVAAFSGFLFINDNTHGGGALIMLSGGVAVKIGGSEGFTITEDNESTINVYYDGSNYPTIQNKTGDTIDVRVLSMRLYIAP